MLSDEWLSRYLLTQCKWNRKARNGNTYNCGDYNSSFALCAVELKTDNEAEVHVVGGGLIERGFLLEYI